jgi:flagellar assembly factor FliW
MGEIVVPVPTYGVENLKKMAAASAKIVSIGSRVYHGNYLALFGVLEPINVFKSVDFSVVDEELSDLEAVERKEVQGEFVANLSMINPEVQAKIVAGTDFVEEAIALVGEGVGVVNKGVAFVNRLKQFVGA